MCSSGSFTLAITFVFMNLFIGVILDGFDAASSGSTDVITQEDFARFAELWAVYDPHATCLITVQARFTATARSVTRDVHGIS